jgi:hypothetical protein
MMGRIRRKLELAGARKNNTGEPEEIDPAHLRAVQEGLTQAKRRQFANGCRSRSRLSPLRAMKLHFTPRAVRDLAEIADYIREHST